MNPTKTILAVNGSYRDDGITDQAVAALSDALRELGAEVEQVRLREYPIEFCRNCRHCMQEPGEQPGECIHNDAMRELVDKIEHADGYVFAAPTNFYSVTALFKRFQERLAVYAYWPWGRHAPVFRKKGKTRKPAVLVSSCAAPATLGRLSYATRKQLKDSAVTVGSKVVGTMLTGLIAQKPDAVLPRRTRHKAKSLAARLVHS